MLFRIDRVLLYNLLCLRIFIFCVSFCFPEENKKRSSRSNQTDEPMNEEQLGDS